jgi:hypothetical protein
MFTTAAFLSIAGTIIGYGIVVNVRRRNHHFAALLLIPAVLVIGLAIIAIYGATTNSDPMLWIRQPMPCSVRTGC